VHPYPINTRVRKINASPGMIPTGSTGTIKHHARGKDGRVFAYYIEWDGLAPPRTIVVTPIGRVEAIRTD
jgi:hypothetical protein